MISMDTTSPNRSQFSHNQVDATGNYNNVNVHYGNVYTKGVSRLPTFKSAGSAKKRCTEKGKGRGRREVLGKMANKITGPLSGSDVTGQEIVKWIFDADKPFSQ